MLDTLEERCLLSTIWIPGYAEQVVVDPLRQRLYLATASTTVKRYDLATRTYLEPWTLPGACENLDISADGSTLYAVDKGTGGITAINLLTDSQQVFPAPAGPFDHVYGLLTLADGRLIVETMNVPARSYDTPLQVASFDPATAVYTPLFSLGIGGMFRNADHTAVAAMSNTALTIYRDGAFSTVPISMWAPGAGDINADGSLVAAAMVGYMSGASDNVYRATGERVLTGIGMNNVFVFDNHRPVLYFVSGGYINSYDTRDFRRLGAYPIDPGEARDQDVGWAKHAQISPDGSTLFIRTTAGVLITDTPAKRATNIEFTTTPKDGYRAQQPITLAVRVGPADATGPVPTGLVTFLQRDSRTWRMTPLLTVPVVDGVATLPPWRFESGTQAIFANYSGDGEYAWSTGSRWLEVAALTPTVTVSVLPATGGPFTAFHVVVRVESADTPVARAAGEIYLTVASPYEQPSGTYPVVDGVAVIPPMTLPVGVHSFTASYHGDRNFAWKDWAASAVITVSRLGTSTTLAVTPSEGLSALDPVTLTARVLAGEGAEGHAPTGQVQFWDTVAGVRRYVGNAVLADGIATLVVRPSGEGTHRLSAAYVGDTSFQSSTSADAVATLAILRALLTLDISPVNGGIVTSLVTLSAILDLAPGGTSPSGVVRFVDRTSTGDVTLATVPIVNGQARRADFLLSPGPHEIRAVYAGDANFAAAESDAFSLIAGKLAITLTLMPANTPGSYVVTLAGAPAETFTGVYLEDARTGKPLETYSSHAGNTWTFNMAWLYPGSYLLRARFGGTNEASAAVSATLPLSIPKVPVTISLGFNRGELEQSTGFSMMINWDRLLLRASLTGRIDLYDNYVLLKSLPVADGWINTPIGVLTPGPHVIMAAYSGDAYRDPVNSAPLTFTKEIPAIPVIDVLALYTTFSAAAVGGEQEIRTYLDSEIANANNAYKNSNIPLALRLAAVVRVDYREAGDFALDLHRLSTPGDGYLDEVPALRDTVGADLVVLVNAWTAADANDRSFIVAGIATRLQDATTPAPETSAYIVLAQSARNNYTLAHEVGHTLGAGHALGDRTDGAAAPYGHGGRFKLYDGTQVRDIMAYAPGHRIPYFSNPALQVQGAVIGDPETADIARLFRETAPLVAGYRESRARFSVERFDETRISGWALDPRAADSPLYLHLRVDGKEVALFSADRTRVDLTPIFGSAAHGFAYTLPRLAPGEHDVSLYTVDAGGETMVLASRTVSAPPLLFDEDYYLARNPDVAAAVGADQTTAWGHFSAAGQFENRFPSAYFDAAWYLAQNPDVAAALASGAIRSAWQHYLGAGQAEGRSGSPYFDEAYYRRANADVARAIARGALRSGLEHFLLAGRFENRRPMLYFNPATYAQALTAEERAAAPEPYDHFLRTGNAAGKDPVPWFSTATYLANNRDVATAVAAHRVVSAFDHFVRGGWRERRVFSTIFSEAAYLAHNPDVATAVADGAFDSGFEHFLLAGQYEGRRM
jgi:hypothetical protein